MANKGQQGPLGATDSGPRPGAFPVGSVQSRAAARSMLMARRSSEEDEQSFEVVYGAKGSVVEIRGLADAISATRLQDRAEGERAAARPIEGGRDDDCGGGTDCFAAGMGSRATSPRSRSASVRRASRNGQDDSRL